MDLIAVFGSAFVALVVTFLFFLFFVKDDFPQLLKMKVSESSANTSAEQEYKIPVVPNSRKGFSVVMNLQSIKFVHPVGDNGSGDGTNIEVGMISEDDIKGDGNSHVVDHDERHLYSASGGYSSLNRTRSFEDGVGRGILVATDALFIRGKGLSQTGALSNFKAILKYTMVEVPLEEYLGIVSGLKGA